MCTCEGVCEGCVHGCGCSRSLTSLSASLSAQVMVWGLMELHAPSKGGDSPGCAPFGGTVCLARHRGSWLLSKVYSTGVPWEEKQEKAVGAGGNRLVVELEGNGFSPP